MRVIIEKNTEVPTEMDLPVGVRWERCEAGWKADVESLESLWAVLGSSPTGAPGPRSWKLFAGGVDRHGFGERTFYLRAIT